MNNNIMYNQKQEQHFHFTGHDRNSSRLGWTSTRFIRNHSLTITTVSHYHLL